MSLSPERQAKLEENRAFQRNQWRISTDCGNPPSEARKVWDMMRLEMTFYCPAKYYGLGVSIAYHARAWVENRNPFHVDAAVQLCDQAGFAPPPTLAALVAEVARARMAGSTRDGTADKIKREAAKDYALNLMTNLCAAGLNVEQASIKAAAQLLNPVFSKRYNASSLNKFYNEKWRDIEKEKREYWKSTEEGAALLAEWLRLIPQMPDAPPESRGERR
ncbi:MAG: hypothetical protein WCY11_04285 [Novosphingobium sp.]